MTRRPRAKLIEELVSEVRSSHAARDAFDEAVARHLGVNRTDLLCMDLLERRGAMSAGELALATGLTTGAITAVLDRLERAGYARRVRDTVDRRRVHVELTDAARERAGALYRGNLEEGLALFDRYSADELTLLRDFVRADRELNERQLERVEGAAQGLR
jgi:DNA-binding MarR family transcriptional regulator